MQYLMTITNIAKIWVKGLVVYFKNNYVFFIKIVYTDPMVLQASNGE